MTGRQIVLTPFYLNSSGNMIIWSSLELFSKLLRWLRSRTHAQRRDIFMAHCLGARHHWELSRIVMSLNSQDVSARWWAVSSWVVREKSSSPAQVPKLVSVAQSDPEVLLGFLSLQPGIVNSGEADGESVVVAKIQRI